MTTNALKAQQLATSNDKIVLLDGGKVDELSADLREIAHHLLHHLAADRGDAARACLERLFRLRGRFQAYPLLREIVDGRQVCVQSGSINVIGGQSLSPIMAKNFEEAIAQCAAFLELPVPSILLQRKAETRDLHLTMESFPGLATMRLSTLSEGYPDDMRKVQFHEVAHCFLTCGVRLLDEGLAHFFAGRFADARLPDADLSLLPGTRTLLSRSAEAMFGESIDSNVQVYQAACKVGADLIESIYALGGASAITTLFSDVSRAVSDAEVIAYVERASQQTFPLIASSSALSAEQVDLISRAQAAFFKAWESKRIDDFNEVLAELEAANPYTQPALLDSLIGVQLNRALLMVNNAHALPAVDLAAIDLSMKAAETLPAGTSVAVARDAGNSRNLHGAA